MICFVFTLDWICSFINNLIVSGAFILCDTFSFFKNLWLLTFGITTSPISRHKVVFTISPIHCACLQWDYCNLVIIAYVLATVVCFTFPISIVILTSFTLQWIPRVKKHFNWNLFILRITFFNTLNAIR